MNEQQKKLVNEKWFSAPVEKILPCKNSLNLQLDADIEIEYRNIFDRDRDRILYSKTFRRLNGKTQIFIPRQNDYVRTRLTHSLEVNQIAPTIGKGLGLNLTLIEAISLGHDVGHTPFGHAGEYELHRIMNNCLYHSCSGYPELSQEDCGFKHNFQSIRVLCELEYIYGKKGLTLTPFTLRGILNHTKLMPKPCEYDNIEECPRRKQLSICPNRHNFSLDFYTPLVNKRTTINSKPAWSFEGIVVNIADEIAQIHHDIEDSLFMNIISVSEAKTYIDEYASSLITGQLFKNSKDKYQEILQEGFQRSKIFYEFCEQDGN